MRRPLAYAQKFEIADRCTSDIQICMKSIGWNRARAFLATAEVGSLSAAAREVGLTQPTLSRQVAALEAELGVTLFERVGKKLVLTETGESLLEHVRAMGEPAVTMTFAASGRAQAIEGRVTVSATRLKKTAPDENASDLDAA
jgi:DNA-binding transcriptional LysR family regulator